MERKLASIQRVLDKAPIFDRDGNPAHSIEQITVLGWRLVAKKGEFDIGDLCVYFEIDSLFPSDAGWVQTYAYFLEARGWRVKTLKLNNLYLDADRTIPVISQGLALPMEIMGNYRYDVDEGQNVTPILGVLKYEVPEKYGMGDIAGPFPDFISKTDEIRLQSAPHLLGELTGEPYYITLKYDGTSTTIWYDEGLHVSSRNNERKNGDNVYWAAAKKYPEIEQFLSSNPQYVLQGETYGSGIQSNPLNIKGIAFACFNVFDRANGVYVPPLDAVRLCVDNGIPFVEILEAGPEFGYTLSDLEERAKGVYDGTDNPREGIVIRHLYGKYSPHLSTRISFKVINVDYLLERGE